MIYKVIVDISNSEVDRVFDYNGKDGIPLGTRVIVPFGGRLIEGFIVAKSMTTDYKKELKDIEGLPDEYPVLIPEALSLCEFMKERYNLKTVDCMRLFIPSQMRKGKVKELIKKEAYLLLKAENALNGIRGNAKSQRSVIEYLVKLQSENIAQLKSLFGASAVNVLIDKGIIGIRDKVVRRRPYSSLKVEGEFHTLTPKQLECVNAVLSKENGRFLLHGVTGSGKTEIYMTVIEEVLKRGKNAIMLVPEISLTPGVMSQFRKRFGENVALLHSGLSAGERYDEWRRLRDGDVRIAIGARSAVFAPLSDLGVIIIDEEHDGSYQSESNPRYNTIDIATKRAEYNRCSLLLGSATPSLDTYYSTLNHKYELLELPERINGQPLPKVDIVDMTAERIKGNPGFLSEKLKDELTEVVKSGRQAILFLNRRGYSSFVMCSKCGYVAKCLDCEVSLTYHRDENVLKCHYCGKKYKMIDLCPNCKSEYLRRGKIGTEQVEKELRKMFPDTGILRMDYDTMQGKNSHTDIIEIFKNRKAQILVGTQMVAKGHDFPFVTLVGILEGDQSLYMSDYRSAERTFQLITQVAGRCGRKDLKGKVVLQTYTPNHFALVYAAQQDYHAFYRREINIREAAKFPPFCKIVRVLYSGLKEESCIECINAHYSEIQDLKSRYENEFIFLQKMRSPLKRIENKFRFQILMRIEIEKSDEIVKEIYSIVSNKIKDVSVFTEVNPQNLS